MRSFLLLILSLIAGCEASSDVKGCIDGWVIFTCKYKTYENITVVTPTQETIPSTQRDVWQHQGRFSVYHNTQKNKVKVAIRDIQQQDFGKYECKFYKESDSSDDNEENTSSDESDSDQDEGGNTESNKGNTKRKSKTINVEADDNCQRLYQTAYRAAKTTITCDYNPNKDDSREKFFCKDNSLICEDILSKSSKSNGTFNLTETNRGFNVSISNVSPQHAGVYWCGAKSKGYRYALRKIQLGVEDITNFTSSPTTGQNLTYWCKYPAGAYIKTFICKGEDPSICEPLVSTSRGEMNTEKFSLKENRPKRNITVTVKNVSTEDTGIYWCGAELTNKTRRFFHKLEMTVVTPPAPRSGGSWLFRAAVAVLICVALLVLILVFIYKRFQQPKTIGEAKKNEERAYEEIQERPQKPGPGTAPKTIYVTAEAPTNPTAPQYYSTINFPNSSKTDSGDMYSTVGDQGQLPVYSTVNPAFRPSEDPFYSTVNMPQQQ